MFQAMAHISKSLVGTVECQSGRKAQPIAPGDYHISNILGNVILHMYQNGLGDRERQNVVTNVFVDRSDMAHVNIFRMLHVGPESNVNRIIQRGVKRWKQRAHFGCAKSLIRYHGRNAESNK